MKKTLPALLTHVILILALIIGIGVLGSAVPLLHISLL